MRKSVEQFGVRYGDGEVEGPFTSRRDAVEWRDRARRSIESGEWAAGDYEPMTIVARTWRLRISKWTEETP